MKKHNVLRWTGIGCLTLGLLFNLQYAWMDYGMHDNTLGTQLKAQTNGGGTTGGGSTGGDCTCDGGGSTDGGGSSTGDDCTCEGGGSSGGGTTGSGWKRTNSDCVYTVTGEVGADAYILGIYIGKIGGKGIATYEAKDAQTDCAYGGNQQCEARYCPTNPFKDN